MTATIQNPMCDGSHCTSETGEVRVLPVTNFVSGGCSNVILCRACHWHELSWRRERNRELAPECQFDLPAFETLKFYTP